MNKNLNFDFCIIPNPFSNGIRNIIFIAKLGDNFLDKSLTDSIEYMDIKYMLEKFGYTETNHLQFESSNNSTIQNYTPEKIREFLEDYGLRYSRELEVNIVRDLTNLKNETNNAANKNMNLNSTREFVTNKVTESKLTKSKSELFKFKHQEPEISKKVTLYFYLFLDFGFNQFSKPIIQFGGDFNSSKDHDNRNYIKIVSSDFERVVDPMKPNSIVLSSCKTQSDFLREAGILYSGFFKYQRNIENMNSMIIQEKKYPYKLAEVKKFIEPKQSIVIETNRMGYDKLITLSNRIKTESIIESRQFISTSEIERKAIELSNFLNYKIQSLSEHDQFEEAAKMKKDVDFIINQIEYIKRLETNQITTEQYFKLFPIY